MNEQDLILLDELQDILEGFEKDVYRPDMYSQERLAKALREQLRRATAIVASYRQVAESIVYAPVQAFDNQLHLNDEVKQSIEGRLSA